MQQIIVNPPEFISDERYVKDADKTAGRKSPGAAGGEYLFNDNNQSHRLMIKLETDKHGKAQPHKVIAEYLGAMMVGALIPGSVPQTYLISALKGVEQLTPDETGDSVYLASVFFKKYYSFSRLCAGIRDANRYAGQETTWKKSRLRAELYDFDEDKSQYTKCKYPKYDDLIIASVLINDFDVISTNIGASPIIYGKYFDKDLGDDVEVYAQHQTTRTVRLDFGEGLGKLEDDVHIHSHTRHPFGFGPTNHVREIPRSVKISKHFADTINEMCAPARQEALTESIRLGLSNVSRFYGIEPIKAFAVHAGFKDAVKCQTKAELVSQLHGYLSAKMQRRMESLKQLETEIRMSLCFKRESGLFPRFHCKQKIVDLMHANPVYFIKGDFHFRKKDQRFNLGVLKYRYQSLPKKMQSLVEGHLNVLIDNAVEKGQPEVIEALRVNTKLHYPAISFKQYQDAVAKSAENLITQCSHRAYQMRTRIIEEILLEKSAAHRGKIIDRYIKLVKTHDNSQLKLAITAALNNPAIKRLTPTLIQLGWYVELDRANKQPVSTTNHRIDPVLQAKWLQLSEACEPTTIINGLVGRRSRLFADNDKALERTLTKIRKTVDREARINRAN